MINTNELPIDTTASAIEMAETMFGNGITIVSASYTGAENASGIYTDGDSTADVLTPSDTGVILSTGSATDVTNTFGPANMFSGTSTNNFMSGDADLTELSGMQTYDAAVLEAEFIPAGETLTMQVTFSSEEYLEYVNSGFNDVVGIWVNGEKAVLTVGTGDISIDNINDESNQNLYIDNPAGSTLVNTEMDGLTVTLTLKAPVTPGVVNTIKIGIADGGDGIYDSNLLIAGDSVQTALIAQDDEFNVGSDAKSFDVLGNDEMQSGASLTITSINGVSVSPGDEVFLSTGESIVLNDDGTLSITSNGLGESNVFNYEVTDTLGNTDSAFVTLNSVACFTAGSLIDTPRGPIPVQELAPGDLVLTRDDGAQPVRWVGMTTVTASGANAPILFRSGAIGTHEDVTFSPNHRVLLTSEWAELLFAEPEVLVKAKDLVNDRTIQRRADGRPVTYVHLLFDRHQILRCNGLCSESFQPGPQTVEGFDPETRDEVLRLFPEAATECAMPAARRALKGFEAALLDRAM